MGGGGTTKDEAGASSEISHPGRRHQPCNFLVDNGQREREMC